MQNTLLHGKGLFPVCGVPASQITLARVLPAASSSSRRATRYPFTGAVAHEVHTVVSSVTHCAGSQSTWLVVDTALRPISIREMQVIALGVF